MILSGKRTAGEQRPIKFLFCGLVIQPLITSVYQNPRCETFLSHVSAVEIIMNSRTPCKTRQLSL